MKYSKAWAEEMKISFDYNNMMADYPLFAW